jgi:hypothetical protein
MNIKIPAQAELGRGTLGSCTTFFVWASLPQDLGDIPGGSQASDAERRRILGAMGILLRLVHIAEKLEGRYDEFLFVRFPPEPPLIL